MKTIDVVLQPGGAWLVYDNGTWRDLGWVKAEKKVAVPLGAVLKRVNAAGAAFYVASENGVVEAPAEKAVHRAATPLGGVAVLAWRVKTPRGVFVDKMYKAPILTMRPDWVGPREFADAYRRRLEEKYREDMRELEKARREIERVKERKGRVHPSYLVNAYTLYRELENKWRRLGRRVELPVPRETIEDLDRRALEEWFRLEGVVRKGFEKARERGLDWAEYLVPKGRKLYPAAPSRYGDNKAYYKESWKPVLEADEPLLEDAARAGLVFGWRRLYRARRIPGSSGTTLVLEPYRGRIPLLDNGASFHLYRRLEKYLEEKQGGEKGET